ncbi:sensor domain-containing diguanylate cyclase [Alishewanella sp. 16-MA]|uniref:Sensor domain-containing diguanylate cyclase n=1 Tax=Alishewanella maricola TaxID=2795740 RepID=A0ABS8C784_9ALTE|nr:diguanylate cyclase [Alishewanella maricola]MCB5227985.1 sensor domain-containing diguanylate cyclase [Alishewanella maricola]
MKQVFGKANGHKKSLLFFALAAFMASVVMLVEYYHRNYAELMQIHQHERLSQQLSSVRANIESELNSNIFLADSLATLISVNPQSDNEQLTRMAEALYLKSSSLRNIALAPDNVIRFVYPLTGNESVIGFDYRQSPEQLHTVELAKQRQEVFIAGPLTLIQGNQAIIARMPIFTDPPFNQRYWGTCSAVIEIDKLFKLAGVNELAAQSRLAIRGKDGLGANGEVFFGDESVFAEAFSSETIRLINGSWLIAIAELPGTSYNGPALASSYIRVIGYGFSLLLLLVFISLFYSYHFARINSLQDPLTLLPNRRFAMKWLETLINSRAEFCIISLDLDKFKLINDRFGHAIGDQFLQEVARLLQINLRSSDVACRLSGDEFLVIMPRISKQQDIQPILQKIMTSFKRATFFANGQSVAFELSLGTAFFPSDAQDLESLLNQADVAMYQQKASHKLSQQEKKQT